MSKRHPVDQPLGVPEAALGEGSPIPLVRLPTSEAVIARFADDLLAEYRRARAAGREKVVFIVPVGPVGQFDLLAPRPNAEGESLPYLVALNMYEYLSPDGGEWIPQSDPLRFRRHLQPHL